MTKSVRAIDSVRLLFDTLSHELRTPLAAMQTAVEVLRSTRSTEEHREKMLDILERTVRYQARFVEELLGLSSTIRGGGGGLEEVDLHALVASTVAKAAPDAAAVKIRLEVESDGRALLVSADRVHLEGAFSSILSNAVKISESGASVSLNVGAERDRAVVRVRCNVKPAGSNRLAELARESWRSLPTTEDGLEVGFALARTLLSLYGGSIEAGSPAAERGELTAWLPLLPNGEAEVESPKISSAMNSKRVLIVEDNQDLRESLKILIEVMGHAVRVAETGGEALELARAEAFDLALVDIGLPDMDGYELAGRLRAENPGSALRLAALTGYTSPEHRKKALSAGFDHHLGKPVAMEELSLLLE
jgi:CheY-like chemotaxis protein